MYKLKSGINLNCPNESYHRDKEYLSSSVLKIIYKNIEDYYKQYILGEKDEYSPSTLNAFMEGSATHCKILEAHLYTSEFNFFSGIRKSGIEWENFLSLLSESSRNKPILSRTQQIRVDALVSSFYKDELAKSYLQVGKENSFVEHTLCGELFNVPIKVRADYISIDDGYITDIKTTSSTNDDGSFAEVSEKLCYHLSGALYCMMYEQEYKKPFDFYFVVLSKTDGTCKLYKLSKKSREIGEQMIKVACAKYVEAKKTGIWTEPLQEDAPESEIPEV